MLEHAGKHIKIYRGQIRRIGCGHWVDGVSTASIFCIGELTLENIRYNDFMKNYIEEACANGDVVLLEVAAVSQIDGKSAPLVVGIKFAGRTHEDQLNLKLIADSTARTWSPASVALKTAIGLPVGIAAAYFSDVVIAPLFVLWGLYALPSFGGKAPNGWQVEHQQFLAASI